MKSCSFKNSTFLNSKFNPITTLIKSLALTLIVLILASVMEGVRRQITLQIMHQTLIIQLIFLKFLN